MEELPLLNIAGIIKETESLGPGKRSVLYLRGCAQHCPGCIAPGWLNPEPAQWMRMPDIVAALLSSPHLSGVTFSGGEPFLQAPALAELIRSLKTQRPLLTFLAYSGYTLTALHSRPDASDLLELLDVLIDGPYIQTRNDGRGLRGSDNQIVHFLSGRIKPEEYDFTLAPRRTHLFIQNGQVFVTGIPSPQTVSSLVTFNFPLPGHVRV